MFAPKRRHSPEQATALDPDFCDLRFDGGLRGCDLVVTVRPDLMRVVRPTEGARPAGTGQERGSCFLQGRKPSKVRGIDFE